MHKYPLQCISIKRKAQVLSIDTHLAKPNDVKTGPLEIPGYSLFKLTLIDKKGKKTIFPFANIPEADVPLINKITDIAIAVLVDKKEKNTKASSGGATTSVRFKTGRNIGKTPMEVLLENPETNEKALIAERDFLGKNAEKFPYNRKVMEAIDEAIKIHKEGKPTEAEPVDSVRIVIYEQDCKFLERIKKPGDSSRCMFYSVLMAYDSTKKYPFTVRVANAYAKLVPTSTGGKKVDLSTVEGKEESTMSLTESEFVQMVSRMNDFHEAFLTVNFGPQYKKAITMDEENIAAKMGTAS